MAAMSRQGYTTSLPNLAVGQHQTVTRGGQTLDCVITSVTELDAGVYAVEIEPAVARVSRDDAWMDPRDFDPVFTV